jgi:hypothetical protein
MPRISLGWAILYACPIRLAVHFSRLLNLPCPRICRGCAFPLTAQFPWLRYVRPLFPRLKMMHCGARTRDVDARRSRRNK